MRNASFSLNVIQFALKAKLKAKEEKSGGVDQMKGFSSVEDRDGASTTKLKN